MIGVPMIKLETFVVTFFHLQGIFQHSFHAEQIDDSRVMLNNVSFRVLCSSLWVPLVWRYTFARDDELCMRHTGRPNLETLAHELVLSVNFTKVLPSWSFAITSGSGLPCKLDSDDYKR